MNAVVMLVAFFLLIFLKVPVAISMLLTSFITVFFLGIGNIEMVGQAAFSTLYSFTTLAIPFYILAGSIMMRGAFSKKLCDVAEPIFGRITGGLGIVTVVASAFFAALSGSGAATTAAIGGTMYPEMEKAGYRKSYALAIAAAGGVAGPIIPPSVSFVLFGVATGTSIGDLFIGGVLPGCLFAACVGVAVYLTAKKYGYLGSGEKFSMKRLGAAIWKAKWAILVPVIILGGIYGGIFTPTEAGAVACIYSLIVCMFIEHTLDFKGLIGSIGDAAVTTAAIMLIIGAAGVFGRVMTLAQVPQLLSDAILSIAPNKVVFLILVNIVLLVVGCIMEGGAIHLILGPLLMPIALHFGIDPVHFGLIECLNVSIGAITPPVGVNLFTASIVGNVKFEAICREILPFLVASLLSLILVVIFPQITLLLVNMSK